jgi:KUP system potassium uptake protein
VEGILNQNGSKTRGIIQSFGLVFGDIGTSPIYTLTVIFLMPNIAPVEDHIIGILSLIIWTLIIIVTGEYAWLAMSLSRKGEGGTIVLKEILIPLLSAKKHKAFVSMLVFIGISLLIGDGVITPAISILSAVEGTLLIPGYEKTSQDILVYAAAGIAIALFSIQSRGTGKVAGAFGPIMLLWFAALAVSGIISIMKAPQVLNALNPYYGIGYLFEHGVEGVMVLSSVILCATGGEALYADMGHLGRKPIVRAWSIVFIVLVFNYLGQGAFLINNPGAKIVLYEMFFSQASILYIPFLILSIAATVIASQAMISGMFSIVYQGITTHIMPLFKVDYTSREIHSQIYIGFVNWFLLCAVLFIIFHFEESSKLAAAYGLAVNGDMVLTAFLMIWIFTVKKSWTKAASAFGIMLIVLVFLYANFFKLPQGGYWSIIIAAIPFFTILIYTQGQKRLYKCLKPRDTKEFIEKYRKLYRTRGRSTGTALFFARDAKMIPTYMVNTMFFNNIIYEDNIMVTILRLDYPFGVTGAFRENLAEGLRVFQIRTGYLEVLDIETILKEAGIDEKTIFYGLEDIATRHPIWKIFAIMKRLTPAFVQFYKLPSHKLHGIVTRVEM